MYKLKTLITGVAIFWTCLLTASNIHLSQPILYMENDDCYAVFNLSWENSWKHVRNHDAVWIFFKALPYDAPYRHVKVAQAGHAVVANFFNDSKGMDIEVPADRTGLFISLASPYRGNIEISLKVALDRKDFEGLRLRGTTFKAYGIEMVEIPQGGFTLGDPSPEAPKYGSFYKPDKNGEFAKLVQISSEDQVLEVGKTGDLFYQAPKGYEGDQQGTIPATFPKGVAPFYIMKYEITEGQYVQFLNSLDTSQVKDRLNFEAKYYDELGGTISPKGGYFDTPFPGKPCAFLSWEDAMAYADWTGLRPMTEFEFTKACRGASEPVAKEFPWGADEKSKVQRLPNRDGELVMLNQWTEADLYNKRKVHFGASYYWVMDLAGSLWERMVSIGHPNGRSYTGTHGDGILSDDGIATNSDWPTGEEDSGGVGFRGGGFYGYERDYHEYNPFSPIAYRPYGGWHGTLRSNAYGTRLVRSK
ncbi:MAG: hypothetical protein DWQ02_08210 [Bacteroidetes bacterium]|nr:MAG: hypothetical protein DWQ02_08210 [Bacteroidota bacterium]